MNALKQYVDVYKKWFDIQLNTSQEWFEAMRGIEQFKPDQLLGKTVDAYQASVQGTLDAEVASSKIWFEEVVPVDELPQPAVDLAKQMQKMTEKFTETQQTLADKWFELLRQTEFNALPVAVVEEPEKKPAPKAAKKA